MKKLQLSPSHIQSKIKRRLRNILRLYFQFSGFLWRSSLYVLMRTFMVANIRQSSKWVQWRRVGPLWSQNSLTVFRFDFPECKRGSNSDLNVYNLNVKFSFFFVDEEKEQLYSNSSWNLPRTHEVLIIASFYLW